MLQQFNLTIIGIFLLFSVSHAQVISGKIKDSRSKESLSGVNIILKGTSAGTISDKDGKYQLTLQNNSKTTLVFSFVGYQTEEISLEFGQTVLNVSMKPNDIIGDVVEVNAHRADEYAAMSFQTLSAEKIKSANFGQDIPYILNQSPSVVVTSDAGNGIGYSGIRIRGIDPARINVTINGIPWNDAESHGMYWVDLPDLASSVDNIQIQRGVGTSTNGPAAFGATIDLQTFSFRPDSYAEYSTTFGTYNTRKNSVLWGSGMLSSGWMIDGRLSQITSDGYIDRSSSDLNSLYFSASHYGEHHVLQFNVIQGNEKTYQSWFGVSEADLETDRKINYYTYENQTDNYVQNHYQLHYKYSFSENLNVNTSLFLTRGAGYYEEFNEKDDLFSYNMDTTISRESDLIRRKWLDNAFYGGLVSVEYQLSDDLRNITGGGVTHYTGDHYGEVIWAEYFNNRSIKHRYYDDVGEKQDLNFFNKTIFNPVSDITLFADLQLRSINYRFFGFEADASQSNQQDNLTFFNPKVGFTWENSENLTTYISIAKGSKEPTRDEYVNSSPVSRPKAETMIDIEAGFRSRPESQVLNMNLYVMNYDNQLVLTGEINDVGQAVRTNVSKSFRLGLETEYGIKITENLEFETNLTLSTSSIEEFNDFIVNYDDGSVVKTTYKDKPIAYSPQIIENASLRFADEAFSAEIASKYVGKQYLDNTGNNSKVLNSYLVTDLKFGYTISHDILPAFKKIKFSLAVNNVFNELYESNGYTYSFIYDNALSVNNFYYPQAERNFLFQAHFSF